MCGRFTLKAGKKVKLKGLNHSDFEGLIPRYNIAPTQDIITVVQRDSNRETMSMQWGLIPFWSKEPKGCAVCLEKYTKSKLVQWCWIASVSI